MPKILVDFNFSETEIKVIQQHLHKLAKQPNSDSFDFDFPDYAGLPKSIYQKFSGDQVDAIQNGFVYGKNSFSTIGKMKSILLEYGLP
jgi:hypothetical protein